MLESRGRKGQSRPVTQGRATRNHQPANPFLNDRKTVMVQNKYAIPTQMENKEKAKLQSEAHSHFSGALADANFNRLTK